MCEFFKTHQERRKRSDPFNQQTVDSSYLNEVRQEKLTQLPSNGWKQEQQQRSYDAFRDDTRVNDLLLENTRRGGYVRKEPDAEFLQDYWTIIVSLNLNLRIWITRSK